MERMMVDAAAAAFAKISAGLKPVAEAARVEIVKAGPSLREELKWGSLCFAGKGLVCAIVAHKTHVNLQFFRGTEVDPEGKLLEGTGKALRHIKLRSPLDAEQVSVRSALNSAVALDEAGA